MRKIFYCILALAALMIVACDDVKLDDRLIYVEPPQVSRAVLIEDYTGQYCVNCPRATDEIERMVEEYGDTTVIAVAIHSGPFSKQKGVASPLYVPVGDEYFNHWGMSGQPVGLVDRLPFGPLDFTDWAAGVNYELAKKAPISIGIDGGVDVSAARGSVTIEVIGLDSALINGKLQVWLVEDSIDSFQLMPDGSRSEHYNHMHVLRMSVNDPWGDDLSVNHGQVVYKNYDFSFDAAWKPEHCAIVAFLYDDQGVMQVAKNKLKR